MTTVNSLSGGKTSSYLAVHYPADIDIFSLVCIDDHNAAGPLKWDRKLVQMVQDKLNATCPQFGEFKATAEDPKTLRVMFDLEQKIGREITWVRGESFERIMDIKKAIPNQFKRFCTTLMKIVPIFNYLYQKTDLPVLMRVGFRWDEMERARNFDEAFKFAYLCEYQPKSNRYINRWKDVIWRKGDFVLIEDRVIHPIIENYWSTQSIEFPEDSNCLNCFWKDVQQLRRNFDTNPAIMKWAAVQEVLRDHTFKKEQSLFSTSRIAPQLDFMLGTGAGCSAGFCTS